MVFIYGLKEIFLLYQNECISILTKFHSAIFTGRILQKIFLDEKHFETESFRIYADNVW